MRLLMFLSVLWGAMSFAQQEQPAADSAEASQESAAPESSSAADSSSEEGGVKTMSGMSILGNEEAPKALVIVPWKSSQIGDGLGVTNSIDDRARPVDREVFMREVRYYELRSGTRNE